MRDRRSAAVPALIVLVASLAAAPAASAAAPAGAGPAGPPAAPERAEIERCRDAEGAAILVSPRAPRPGEPLRVLAVAPADPAGGALLVAYGPDGARVVLGSGARGAVPRWWTGEIPDALAGTYRFGLGRAGNVAACASVEVSAAPRPRARRAGAVWPVERGWDRATELLYSAWIEKLFDDPLDAEPSWHGLTPVLGDRERNLLLDHLGLGEDDGRGLGLEPDCADLPFFLRAYFAWKLGLPFGYSACSRGGRGAPPRCAEWHSNLDGGHDAAASEVAAVNSFLKRDVGWTIHSGSGRTPMGDDRTDLYPTRIAPDAIRPGTVYADPYGHTLIVVQRLPQTADAGGILLAVDAQPDGSVARKRYWRGNFLFAVDPALGGAGFKHFRPIARDGQRLRPLSNQEIGADPEFGDYSVEQVVHGADGFYDRMDDLLSPTPQDPSRAFRQTIDALDEQIRTRVRSVDNGEKYVASHPAVIAMPQGAAIFETEGAWEDYATPSRDLRLLIAIDVVRGFPRQVARRPERYALPPGRSAEEVARDLEAQLAREAAARRFTYQRSDGAEQAITLADVLARAEALEMAYNPNDCVDVRWGAPPGSAESATCHRRAPAEQQARMQQMRTWFHERRRPPRE